MHVEVRITLRDGRVFEKRPQELSGFAGYPFTRDQRLKKCFACADGIIPWDNAEQVLRQVEALEDLANIGGLMDPLR